MTKPPAMPELPEPELGYIETDKSRQPAFSARQMREALQSAQPAGHSCVFHAAPLVPGDPLGPQTAVCATCGQPPRVMAAQPAAAVSDEEIWWLWDSQERTGLVGGPCPVKFARSILALRPQAVPMTPASRAVIMATRTADGDADEWPEPWAYRRGWNDAEEHHHIRPNAEAK